MVSKPYIYSSEYSEFCTFCFCFVEDADQRFGSLETRTGQVEDQVHSLEGNFEIRH